MVDQVGRFLDRSLPITIRTGGDQLGRLLAKLLEPGIAVGQEAGGVAGTRVCSNPGSDRRIEPAQLVGPFAFRAEAGPGPRVTSGTVRLDQGEHGITVAIGSQRHDPLSIPAGGALVPQP